MVHCEIKNKPKNINKSSALSDRGLRKDVEVNFHLNEHSKWKQASTNNIEVMESIKVIFEFNINNSSSNRERVRTRILCQISLSKNSLLVLKVAKYLAVQRSPKRNTNEFKDLNGGGENEGRKKKD